MKVADITFNDHTLAVIGELDFYNVMSLYQKSLPFLEASPRNVTIDLLQLKNANSAAIALLMEWKKFAWRNQKQIQFQNVPEGIKNIAKSASLEVFL